MPTMLEVEGLTVELGRKTIFRDLGFSVEAGTSLAIVGPNGAGKTMLFRALVGSVPSKGSIRWAPGARLGYVPQKLDLERDIPVTGDDFLHARANLAQIDSRTLAPLVERVGLDARACAQTIGTLSGGQFQRLLLAFALVGEPTVLLLDEPTAGVDEPGQEQLNDLIRRLRDEQGMTVLFISHHLSMVYRDATNVLCLHREHSWCGPPKEALAPERLRVIYGTPLQFHVHRP
jgi:zinc transport system ATP-binding protein